MSRSLLGSLFLATALLCVAAISSLWCSPLKAGEGQPPSLPVNSVRVGTDVEVLASDQNPFLIPIYLRHRGEANVVHIGLDYDELMLRFNDSWSIEGGLARTPWVVKNDADEGYLDLLIPFNPQSGGQDEEVLFIQLEFTLKESLELSTSYGFRASAQVAIDESATYFLRARDQAMVRADETRDGSVTVYFQDALELGSARITPDQQEFRIPVYVTHVQPENVNFLMGLDYDELFLELLRVDPISSLLKKDQLRFDAKQGDGRKAWVSVPFQGGVYPPLLRHHLLDLVFEYQAKARVPDDGMLRIVPIPGQLFSPDEGGGSQEVEIEEGILYVVAPQFIRGDANGSGSVEMNDALVILGYVAGQSWVPFDKAAPPCIDAMDSNGDGQVDVTDGIVLLGYLFLGGPPPPLPFPDAGPNPPGTVTLGCPR